MMLCKVLFRSLCVASHSRYCLHHVVRRMVPFNVCMGDTRRGGGGRSAFPRIFRIFPAFSGQVP